MRKNLAAPPMSTVSVTIRHVSWRKGRPRFTPGPNLRRLGYKGEDLKLEGRWMTLAEVEAWLAPRLGEIDARRMRKASGKRLPPLARAQAYTLERMTEDLFTDPRLDVSAPQTKAALHRAGRLKPRTVKDYRNKINVLFAFDPELAGTPAAAVTKPIMLGMHEALWEAKGLSMANAIVRVLSVAYSRAEARGKVTANPCVKLRLPGAQARLRIGTSAELEALVAAADANKEEEIADAIIVALYTGQRQADVLQLEERQEDEGRIRFIQNKTGARVRVRALPALVARLASARQRKRDAGFAEKKAIVVDRRGGGAFNEHTFRHRFASVRASAAKTCASVATFRFADLRDTAVTRLAQAGCTIPEIASITGHGLESIHTVLKHYLELNEAHADAAIDKLVAWMEKEGVKV